MRRYIGAFLPALLCVALFGATVFWVVLPEVEQAILAKKREMIRELSQAALSLLATYEQQEKAGLLTRGQAQERALDRVRAMRYGSDGRNYFWVLDLATKRMLMHPYTLDLVGKVVSDTVDSRGEKLFQAMFSVLEEKGAGYVSYHYQYMDDPRHDALKTSYVVRFAPWDWAVGTGVYTEDIQADMAKLTKELTWAGLGVWLAVTLLGVYITLRNVKADRQNLAAQQSLVESAQKFRSISVNALDGVVMIDSRHQITFWNQAAQDIFGFQASEVLGRNVLELLTPQRHRREYLTTFRKLLAADQGLVLGNILELVAVDKQGREFPAELSVSGLSLGGQWHVVCVVRNITKRKQAEKALAESEKLYRTLFEKAGEAIFLVQNEQFIDCNAEALRMFRASREQLLGLSPTALSPPQQADGSDSAALGQAKMNQVRAGTPLVFEWLHKRLDGSVFDAEVSLINIDLPDKTFQMAILRDISARKRAEVALMESEGRLRRAQAVGGVGSYEIDLTAGTLWGSEEAVRIYGLESYQTQTLPLALVQTLPLGTDRPRLDQALEQMLKHDAPYEQEYTIQRLSDGQLRRLVSRAELVKDAQGLPSKIVGTVQDITERKLAEEEITKSEATLRGILKASPSGIAMIAYTDRKLIWANQRMAEICGYQLDELLGMPTRDLYFNEDEYNLVGQRTRQGIRAQGFATFQTQVRAKDGRALDILINVAPLAPEDPKQGLVFTALDVSQRVRAENEIRKSEATLRSILQASPSGIAQVSYPERRIVWANERLSEMTGYSLPELLGMSTRDLYVSSEVFDKTAAQIPRDLLVGGEASFETQWRRRDGEVMDVLITVSMLKAGDLSAGQVTSVLDITESKRAQELVRRSEEKYRLILEATPDPVVLYDMRGNVLYLNPAFTRVFGWTLEEMAGRRVDYVPPDEWDKTHEMIALMKQGQVRSDFETRRYNRQGDILHVAMNWSVWRDENGSLAGSVVVLRDVTEHKKMVAQLEQARRMEAIGTLAGGIAHDFNNVLQAISGNVQLLIMRRGLDAGAQDTLAGIDNLTQRAAEMIQQLLAISRKREIKPQAVSLNREVGQICQLLRRIIPKMIGLDLQLAPGLWLINGDQSQLEQIILNLASNATDAMPQGGTLTFQTENVEIDEVFCRTHPELRPGPHVLLRAADTGHGIDKEDQKHIFDPFFTTKQSGKGTGLGLSTIYGIVNSHLGLITCYSTPGQGTAFNIYFPALADLGQGREPLPAGVDLSSPGGSETVLLVDDEADILKVGQEILGMFGYRVLAAGSGEEALSLYGQHGQEIDLVILDLNMSGMGGQRCLESLLQLDPAARVIISSGYYTHLTARDLGDAGAQGFIAKPYRLTDMVKRVREVLDRNQS